MTILCDLHLLVSTVMLPVTTFSSYFISNSFSIVYSEYEALQHSRQSESTITRSLLYHHANAILYCW